MSEANRMRQLMESIAEAVDGSNPGFSWTERSADKWTAFTKSPAAEFYIEKDPDSDGSSWVFGLTTDNSDGKVAAWGISILSDFIEKMNPDSIRTWVDVNKKTGTPAPEAEFYNRVFSAVSQEFNFKYKKEIDKYSLDVMYFDMYKR